MRPRRRAAAWAALALIGALGCDRGAQPEEDAARSGERDGGGYTERFIFLGSTPDTAMAAVVHYVARGSGSTTVHRTRAWLGSGEGWEPLIADDWRSPRLREPERLIPYGELRMLLDDGGDLDALLIRRSEPPIRITMLAPLDELPDTSDASATLHDAVLSVGDASYPGALLRIRQRLEPGLNERLDGLLSLPQGFAAVIGTVGGGLRAFGPAASGLLLRLERSGDALRWSTPDGRSGELRPLAETWRIREGLGAPRVEALRGMLPAGTDSVPALAVVESGA